MSERDRKYPTPASLEEALLNKRQLETDIMNIERQLAEPTRLDRSGNPMSRKEYKAWRSSAHSSLIYKKGQQSHLKSWIIERRRQIDAGILGIFDPNDPRELLVKTRLAIKRALDGDDDDLGLIFNVIDQYLQHAA